MEQNREESALLCAECGSPMVLRHSRFGPFFGCTSFPDCRGTHGAHPDGRPLGIPADRQTKKMRIEAHEAFDGLWQDRGWSRGRGYHWLQKVLRLGRDDCHIGRFDVRMCKRVIAAVKRERRRRG